MNQSATISLRFRNAIFAHIFVLTLLLVGVILVSTGMGYIKIPLLAVAKIIFDVGGRFPGNSSQPAG
jgi:hypothetical protein